jgi:hypothetical protein
MEALRVEQCIFEGDKGIKELFEFIQSNAGSYEAYDMEKAILAKVLKIGLAAMRCYFAERGTGDVGTELELEDGTILRRESGLRGRDYFSVFGKVKIPRSCYRTEGHIGVMPLDAQANLPERCYSYLLQEWMDLLSLRDTFGEAQVSLEKLLGLKVSTSRLEIVNRESSGHYDEFYQEKKISSSDSEGQIQVIGFDGKGVPVIKKEAAKIQARCGKGEKRQKKKEAMVGVSYTVDQKVRTPEQVAKNLIYPERSAEKKSKDDEDPSNVHAQNVRRLASLERSKQEVVKQIVDDAQKRDPEHKRPWVVLMDGALHLWTLVARILKGVDYVGILDIIHVVEYLWKASNALHGEKNPEGKRWVYDHLLSILQGRVGRVIGGLKQTMSKQKLKKSQREAIKDALCYFDNHRKWMQYDQYLQAGYPIGTGVVESTCGHTVKDRMEGTGRRWSIQGAESTLLLRSVYTSGDWIAFWNLHVAKEKERLYAQTLLAVQASSNWEQGVSITQSQDQTEATVTLGLLN